MHLDVQLSVGEDPAAEGLELGEAGVVRRVVKVLGELVKPNMKSLSERAAMLLPNVIPNA